MKILQSFSELYANGEQYDTIACDIYGVLHDGYEPYPYTMETLKELQQRKQDVVLLSNSSRMYSALSQQLIDKFNITPQAYNDILSSGKLTRLFLQDCQMYTTTKQDIVSCFATVGGNASISNSNINHQSTIATTMTAAGFCQQYQLALKQEDTKIRFFIAGDVDYLEPLYRDLTVFEATDDWYSMEFVLVGSIQRLYGDDEVNPFDEESVQQHYKPFFDICLKRGIPFICTNPDVLAPHGVNQDGSQRLLLCPGYIGQLYESMGGTVLYFGKPFSSIYKYLQNKQNNQSGGRILCIGDNVATDVLGANDADLDVVLILGGVHASTLLSTKNDTELLSQVRDLCQQAGTREPTYVMPYLRYQ
ncbi:HAD-like domain-containing protein [Halteromyces radiatus]|uniref:HAD-like domain-containing protein n=1 Tax=Halteromyces radiatus TaxID=101107 RepID=UPI00221EE981|nr:HAD-like domain-containing protein [Halteromyces radiatus]KAI8079768.1 HAD-like domain-containing protein [Halteromyces radiatus]